VAGLSTAATHGCERGAGARGSESTARRVRGDRARTEREPQAEAAVPQRPAQRKRWVTRLWYEADSLRGCFDPRAAFWIGCARLLPDYALARVRAHLFRLGGCDLERGVGLQGWVVLFGPGRGARRLHVAAGTMVAPGVTFGLDADITIGRNVAIGPFATLCTATHAIGYGSRRMQLDVVPRPIVVEDGVWVGMNSLILPGVTLGRGSVVAAGAVVTESVPPNCLVAGNPATVSGTLPFGDR
jgi:acetyltransferase-like isoleucine patch superfamily enzyme